MCVCTHEIMYLIIVKMLMRMKNQSHRHDTNSPRFRLLVNIRLSQYDHAYMYVLSNT